MLFLQLIDLLLPLFLFFHIWKFGHPPKIFLTSHTYVLLLPGLRQWTIIPICWKRTAIFPPGWGKKEEWGQKLVFPTASSNDTSTIQITSTTHLAWPFQLITHTILSFQHHPKQMESNSHSTDNHYQKRIDKDVSGSCF